MSELPEPPAYASDPRPPRRFPPSMSVVGYENDADGTLRRTAGDDPQESVKSQPHYTEGGIEPIDYLRAKLTPEQFEGFLIGNAIKYLSRARLKGECVKDYAKALWYVRVLNGDDPRKEAKQ